MHEYAKAIDFGGTMLHTVVTHWQYFEQQIQSFDTQYNLFGNGFWGYGINHVSDGKQLSTNPDVFIISRSIEQNKHHKYPTFNLIIFKTEDTKLIYNTFCFNIMNMKWQSDLLQQIDLSHLINARPKIQSQDIFVELQFDNLELPISFQVDNLYSHNGEPRSLTKSYIGYLQKIAIEAREKKVKTVVENFIELDKTIDQIEQTLRHLINKEITANINPHKFKHIVQAPLQDKVKERMNKFLRDHPGTDKSKFETLEQSLQFFDFMEYSTMMVNKSYWPLFEKYFNHKGNLERYSTQLSNLRNAIRHSREKTELLVTEGRAAIIWFKGALNLN